MFGKYTGQRWCSTLTYRKIGVGTPRPRLGIWRNYCHWVVQIVREGCTAQGQVFLQMPGLGRGPPTSILLRVRVQSVPKRPNLDAIRVLSTSARMLTDSTIVSRQGMSEY